MFSLRFGSLSGGFNQPRNVRAKATPSTTGPLSNMPQDAKVAMAVGAVLAVIPPAIGLPAAGKRFRDQEAAWKKTHTVEVPKGKAKAVEKPVEPKPAPAPAPVAAAPAAPKKVETVTTTKKDEKAWVKPTIYTAAGVAVGAAVLAGVLVYEKTNGSSDKKPSTPAPAAPTAAKK